MVLVDGQYVTGLGVDQAYVLYCCSVHMNVFRKILNHCFKIWGENQIKLRSCENATKCLRNHHPRIANVFQAKYAEGFSLGTYLEVDFEKISQFYASKAAS